MKEGELMKLRLLCIVLATALFLIGAVVGTLIPIGASLLRCQEDEVVTQQGFPDFEPGEPYNRCIPLDIVTESWR